MRGRREGGEVEDSGEGGGEMIGGFGWLGGWNRDCRLAPPPRPLNMRISI